MRWISNAWVGKTCEHPLISTNGIARHWFHLCSAEFWHRQEPSWLITFSS